MPYIPDHLTSLYPPCFYCKHLTQLGSQAPDLKGWTCPAYPTGIPYDILQRYTKHTESLMSQVGSATYECGPAPLEGESGLWVITFEGVWKRVS